MQKILSSTVAHDGDGLFRPIGYARVSTLDQNPQMQLDALIANGCEKIYHEKASGASKRRPEFGRMMRELRPSDVVVVWKLDRLGRSVRHMLETIATIHERGAKFRVITQPMIDTTTAFGMLLLQIFAAIAEYERELGRERTRAGLASAKARGRIGGRTQTYSDEQIREAMKLFDAGATWAAAAATVIAERGKRKGKAITITRLRARAEELRNA